MFRRVLAVCFVTTIATAASAQTGPDSKAPPSGETGEDAAKKEQAREHFQKGVALFQEEAWEAALAEFLASRGAFPTRAATKNAAVCLRTLHRFDEALDMYEALLREFSDLPAADRTSAERAVTDLGGLVGAVALAGAEPGASIVIDGRDRGKSPPTGPLRVGAGTHVVRLYKEGFAPFESRVDVAGGKTASIDAKMGALTRAGRLRVIEQSGRSLDVLVDNVVVGKTPWEGPLALGDRVVALRGEGDLGTQPVTAPVKLGAVTPLTLQAEELTAALRVEPTPAGATVAVDRVALGRGTWEGRMRSGAHEVEIAAEGFLPTRRQVTLDRLEREIVRVTLQRDPDSAVWKERHPPKVVFELSGGAGLAPSLGGDVAGNCADPCSRSFGVGAVAMLHGGYQFGSGLGLGIGAGYLTLGQSTTNRATRVQPIGLAENPGVADDSLVLRGLLVGATASLHLGDRFPVLVRLGAGALIGSVGDERSGRFQAVTNSGQSYETGALAESQGAVYFHAMPELRAGVRFAERFELTAGIAASVLIALQKATWKDETPVYGDDGQGGFGDQALTGSTLLILTPGLSLRYDLAL